MKHRLTGWRPGHFNECLFVQVNKLHQRLSNRRQPSTVTSNVPPLDQLWELSGRVADSVRAARRIWCYGSTWVTTTSSPSVRKLLVGIKQPRWDFRAEAVQARCNFSVKQPSASWRAFTATGATRASPASSQDTVFSLVSHSPSYLSLDSRGNTPRKS